MTMKYLLAIFLFIACVPLTGQVGSYDEMNIDADSTTVTFRPKGKNYVFIRSKRGTSGVTKSSRADSIISFPVTEIVLVFTEDTPADLEIREEANRERWDNLILTYPEYFQENTTYKSICQCNMKGDIAAFKQVQGFYVYFTGEEPKEETKPVARAPKVEETPEPPRPAKAEEKKNTGEKAAVKETKAPDKEVAPPDNSAVKTKEAPVKEKPQKETVKEEPVVSEPVEETPEVVEKPKPAVKKSPATAVGKPKRSADKKACRPSCYESGDEALNDFFKQNITLTKKQRRKNKKLVSVISLQLHFDGSIKKAMVSGENEVLNAQVQSAVNNMGQWNPAVKNGVAVKSQVRITLKYDKDTKNMKAFEVSVTPRPSPKCLKCMSDAEIFGSD